LPANRHPSAVVTNWQQGAHAITTSVRSNGCTLGLVQITNSRDPQFKGYWIQHAYGGEKHILQVEHSPMHKEQSLAIDQGTGYFIGQIDTNLDGKYEMFVVVSVTNQTLVDVLFVTNEGWLRHGTPMEFETRQQIAERNRMEMKQVEATFRKAAEDAMKDHK
jgi:hypothetical protein